MPRAGPRIDFSDIPTMPRDSAVPIGLGVLLGLGGAMVTARTIETFLFETSPTDPLTLATVAMMLAVSGVLAALVPALRAASVNPLPCATDLVER
ncbi:MAG: hypothetical protein ACT4QD_27670 [Acidobacteriota bacterium]